MTILRACALVFLFSACVSAFPTPPVGRVLEPSSTEPPDEAVLAEDVRVRRLAPGVWLHVTLAGEDWGRIPANGLLIEDGVSSLLVETGWNVRQAELLLSWARDTLHRPVRAGVVTHFHVDRIGGVPALVAQGVPVSMREETARLAAERGLSAPVHHLSDAQEWGALSLFFPGAGHTRDNLVVWHRGSGLLYGGCFVKDAGARDLGNVEDADLSAWPASLERVRQRYPDMRTVLPGHGLPGGPELLAHTQALLRAAAAPPSPAP
ncbi:subclass B1 metallo-beta-lactamase [Melittangium boletus]|uniref:beta-lactamase n=1 Tax=Melittangium boletus DSM 14713 TaxID=1294270 RepID=A0A250IBG9_9BACT|nr:subclass B1 metallo-beta-lactamase [Melittangium boletus]ATB28306.1 subclass B1 metallo-beta-lactamase [Melittangium boletus DSM 14713]